MIYKILALGTYAVDTAEGGGKYVINNLFKKLPTRLQITFLSLVESDKTNKQISVSTNFENIHIPQDIKQAKIQWDEENESKTSLFDVIQINHWEQNTVLIDQVKKYSNSCDIIILEHPYFANLVRSLNTKKPIIYHAHNVEFIQKKSILSQDLLTDVKKVEQLACEIASQIWVSSETEKDLFVSIYQIPSDKLKLLPHGVDLTSCKFVSRETSTQIRSKMKDLSGKTIFGFVGSWHPPNLESLEFIISDLAPLNKNYLFFVIGGVRDYYFHKYPKSKIPENVILLGSISNDEKNRIYELVDYAINPMFSGAGTNLKMLEYMAAGLPIISTDFGARGITISDKTLICKKEEFVNNIKNIEDANYKQSYSIQENYDLVRRIYDYNILSRRCANLLNELIDENTNYLNNILPNLISELNQMTISTNDSLLETLPKDIGILIDPLNY